MTYRIKRINELIKRELGKIFLKELDFQKNCLVTITKVDTSSDLCWAEVWVSIFPPKTKKENFEKLERSIGHLQFLLNKKLFLKPLPRIRFRLDNIEEEIEELENLLDEEEKEM